MSLTEILGGTHDFVHQGKTYKVSLVTQKVKAEFEKRLFDRAKEAASGLRELMDKADYMSHLKQLNDDYISGQYAFESARGVEAMKTVKGFSLLCSLLFGCDEQEMLCLVSERKEEVTSLLDIIFHESFAVEKAQEELKKAEANSEEADAKNSKSANG